MYKKLLVLMLCGFMIFGLCGCSEEIFKDLFEEVSEVEEFATIFLKDVKNKKYSSALKEWDHEIADTNEEEIKKHFNEIYETTGGVETISMLDFQVGYFKGIRDKRQKGTLFIFTFKVYNKNLNSIETIVVYKPKDEGELKVVNYFVN